MKCVSCGTKLEIRKNQKYRFQECGLDNVQLIGIDVHYCPECKTISPAIPYMRQLHLAIGLHLIAKRSRLSGKEIRFLRKELELMSKQMAEQLGYTVKNYSEIENDRHPISGQGDRLIRMWFLFNKDAEVRRYKDEFAVLEYHQALLDFIKNLTRLRASHKAKHDEVQINPKRLWETALPARFRAAAEQRV